MLADVLTKPLYGAKFAQFRKSLQDWDEDSDISIQANSVLVFTLDAIPGAQKS